jgi:hypothetical protein
VSVLVSHSKNFGHLQKSGRAEPEPGHLQKFGIIQNNIYFSTIIETNNNIPIFLTKNI